LTQLDDPLFNPDHIVVYPQGKTGMDVKTAFSGAPYSDTTVDDLQFTNDLLNSVQQSYCVDTSRIFATGKTEWRWTCQLLGLSPPVYDGGKDHGLDLPHVRHFVQEWAGCNGCTNNVTNTTHDNGLVEVFDFGCNTKHSAVLNADHIW
jgi:poly(3-hydroxybutyrate) depolymerase